MSVSPLNNSVKTNLTLVPADFDGLPKDELVRLLKRVANERDGFVVQQPATKTAQGGLAWLPKSALPLQLRVQFRSRPTIARRNRGPRSAILYPLSKPLWSFWQAFSPHLTRRQWSSGSSMETPSTGVSEWSLTFIKSSLTIRFVDSSKFSQALGNSYKQASSWSLGVAQCPRSTPLVGL